MRRIGACGVAAVLALASAAPVLAGDDDASPSPAKLAAIADSIAPGLVRVEITPQYDKGEAPGEDRWSSWRSQWRLSAEGASGGYEAWSQLVDEERPAEHGGVLVGPRLVYTVDPDLHPRFIQSIKVRFGDSVVNAKPAGWPQQGAGMLLELEGDLPGAQPLKFDPAKEGPFYTVSYDRRDSHWITRVSGMRSDVSVGSDGRRTVPGTRGRLVVDAAGAPVAITLSDASADEAWKTGFKREGFVSAEEMAKALSRVEGVAASQLRRVTLNFRSPRTGGDMMNRHMHMYSDGSEDLTEWDGLGVVLGPETVLVLAALDPKVTARLDRIRIFANDGAETAAEFAGTLKDWGGFIAKPESPLPAVDNLSSRPVTEEFESLLIKPSIAVRGETRTAFFTPARIEGYSIGRKGRVLPQVDPGSSEEYSPYSRGGPSYQNFLYRTDGTLVAVPLQQREKVAARERWSRGGGMVMAPASVLAEIVRGGDSVFDSENRPLTEEEENRLAWLGVELQPMDMDLARANGVVEETTGGRSGAIVTYIYPDSPAAKAGLEMGDIILRLHIEGQPRPLEVSLQESSMYGMLDELWANLDMVPEEYLDQLPPPWGNAETSLTRALTDVGFGTAFTAEVWRDGTLLTKEMQVTQGPPHYAAAPRWKSEPLGVTVRDLTYEVRRYMQLSDDEPGVIVSKIEPGSKVAVAGLKPFETIRSVNDQPVKTVAEFEKAIAAGGELRFAVKRMSQGRTVKVTLPQASEQPEDGAP